MAKKTLAELQQIHKDFIASRNKEPEPRGQISIQDIEVKQVQKYHLKPGMVTPNTLLLITD